MVRLALLTFFITCVVVSKAQSIEEDSSGFRSTMDWLERKLTYNYFDPTNQQWWVKCRPTTALDMPLKILVWEEYDDVYIGFIDPKFMKKRFMLND